MSWQVKPLGELAETQLGKMLNSSKQTGLHSRPYLRNVNVQWGWFDMSDVKSMDIFPDEESKFLAQKGDLLICEGGEVGRCAVWNQDEPVGIQNAVHRVRVGSDLDTIYLGHYLQHLALAGGLERFSSGVTIKHLTQEKLRRIPIAYPPLDEQKRIVTQLEDQLGKLETVRTSAEKCRSSLVALRESTLNAVFQVPAGTGSRNFFEIGKFLSFSGGFSYKSTSWQDSGVPVIKIANVRNGAVSLRGCSFVSESLASETAAFTIRKGDLLITLTGEIGAIGTYDSDKEARLNQRLAKIEIKDPSLIDSDFIPYVFSAPETRFRMWSKSKGASQPNISVKDISGIDVCLPTIDEQKTIVQELQGIEKKIDAAEFATEQAELLIESARSSILHRAFLAPEEAL